MGLSSGTFTRPNDFTTDASLGIDPTATKFDQEFDDIKDALDIAIYADGQQTITADIPWNGKKITGLGTATAGTDALNRDTADARYLLKAQLAAGLPVNASITASVGASALTIALKGADGNDPSSTNTVLLPFRSATAGTGSLTVRSVTAATSLVISSGSTLASANSTALSVWVVAFDDAGTIRLGAINCLSGTSIAALSTNALASSTAEGGAGAADSAHVFYTGTAVTTKPYVVLGRLIWNTGLATAGTWNAAPDVIVNYGPGVKLPGDHVQTVESADAALASGTTQLPLDDTIPQNTEGDQYMSQAITPTAASNVLEITHQGNYTTGNTGFNIAAALFQDSTANALAARHAAKDISNPAPAAVDLFYRMRAATTSSTTFKIRAGSAVAGTTAFNGTSTGPARYYGGVFYSRLKIVEIVA